MLAHLAPHALRMHPCLMLSMILSARSLFGKTLHLALHPLHQQMGKILCRIPRHWQEVLPSHDLNNIKLLRCLRRL